MFIDSWVLWIIGIIAALIILRIWIALKDFGNHW